MSLPSVFFGRREHDVAHADDLVELLRDAIGGSGVRLQDEGQLRYPRGGGGSQRETLDGNIAPAQHADRAIQRQQRVVQQYRNGMRGRHGVAQSPAPAGAVSIGSGSEPPGGIIGETFGPCSVTDSSSAGPACSFASGTRARGFSPFFSPPPREPYAPASLPLSGPPTGAPG